MSLKERATEYAEGWCDDCIEPVMKGYLTGATEQIEIDKKAAGDALFKVLCEKGFSMIKQTVILAAFDKELNKALEK